MTITIEVSDNDLIALERMMNAANAFLPAHLRLSDVSVFATNHANRILSESIAYERSVRATTIADRLKTVSESDLDAVEQALTVKGR